MRLRWIVAVDRFANDPDDIEPVALLTARDSIYATGATADEAGRNLADAIDKQATGAIAALREWESMRADLRAHHGS